MTGLFEWFGSLMERLLSFIPRLGICRAGHAGVKFKRGSIVEKIEPGLYVYWPAVTEVETMPVARQTVNLVTQRLTTKDGVPVIFSLMVVYRIQDIVKAVVETWDFTDTIGDVALEAALHSVLTRTWEELKTNYDQVQKELTRTVRSALYPYGVKVEYAAITDMASAQMIAVIANQTPYVPLPTNPVG